MRFLPFSLTSSAAHARYWVKTPQHTADCTFTNLYGWGSAYGIGYSENEGLFWIGRNEEDALRLWMPLGDWNRINWEKAFLNLPQGTQIERTPKAILKYIPHSVQDAFEITNDHNNDEYLYEQSALAELSGRKLHKKRTHVNAFEKLYGIDYRNLTPLDREAILGFCKVWLENREDRESTALKLELIAIERALELWPTNSTMRAGALYVDSTMVAFSMGEMLDDTSFVVHFEKGLSAYRGVYQTINQCFAKNAASNARLINREQDTGDEGLRFAKTSYNPIGFIEKIRLVKL